jgi:4-hydroxy-3-polyprenylbenzoate decarboxylase
MNNRKLVLAIAGSSGSIYAKRLIEKISMMKGGIEMGIVMSDNAIINWELEIGKFDPEEIPFKIYSKNNFYAPFASGSAQYETMIICPSSMGVVGRIANGISDDLITRSADVMLKERRKLIIVPRETPYNLIHLDNMRKLTLAGAIMCPATPSFYSNPATITELVDTVVDRLLDLAGFSIDSYRWGAK